MADTRKATRLAGALIVGALAVSGTGCVDTLDSGEFGTFRYAANVRGEAPLKLVPPIADRALNEYVVWGAKDELLLEAWQGKRGGLWLSSNECTKASSPGDQYGVHGFIGFSDTQTLFWAGYGIFNQGVELAGNYCIPYLDTDPNTKAKLRYPAVIPWIKDTPSRQTFVVFIKSDVDRVPFQAMIDLRLGIYRSSSQFSPTDAEELTILGVGAHVEEETGVVLLRYKRKDTVHVEARFLDVDAQPIATAKLSDGADLPEYAVQGYLQANAAGLFAGLDDKGNLITLDKSGGRIRGVKGMTPVGVHKFQGKLWLVGTGGGGPVVAPIDDSGGVGDVVPWAASRAAASALKEQITVRDDRRLPPHSVTWKAKNAIGEYPFLSPHSPFAYADDTTLWMVAGPSFSVGGEPFTAVAVAPVGIAYP